MYNKGNIPLKFQNWKKTAPKREECIVTRYTGKACVHCEKIFKDDDDIVVCPTCGAPHHRLCYKETGHCALESQHGKEQTWSAANASNWGTEHEAIIDGNAPLRCMRCGTICKPESEYCPICGTRFSRDKGDLSARTAGPKAAPPFTEEQLRSLRDDMFSETEDESLQDNDENLDTPPHIPEGQGSAAPKSRQEIERAKARYHYGNPYSAGRTSSPGGSRPVDMPPIPLNPQFTPYGGVAPEEEIEGIPARDMVLFIGPNSHYYLPRFKMMAGKIGKVQWNWSAFFFHFIYFFYRKMYLAGALFLTAYLLIQLPLFLALPDYIHYLYDVLTSSSMFTTVPASVQWYMNYSYISNFILLILGMFSSVTANRFYFKKVCKDVGMLRSQWVNADKDDSTSGEVAEKSVNSPERPTPDSQSYFLALAQKGRVNIKAVIILMACVMFINFGIPSLAVFWLT